MQIGSYQSSFSTGYVCNIQLQGSNDKSSWKTIKNWGDRAGCNSWHTLDCSTNTSYYNYYRFYAENGGWAYEDALKVSHIEYKGTLITQEKIFV